MITDRELFDIPYETVVLLDGNSKNKSCSYTSSIPEIGQESALCIF